MKEVMLQMIKKDAFVIGIVAVSLSVALVAQTIQHDRALKRLTEKYTDLMIESQPDIQEFPNRKLGRFELTWYSPKELGKPANKLRTSTGTMPKEGRTIAVDPSIIPYGSIVYIQGYGYFIAEDCGGAIKQNRIDIYTNSHEDAIQQGKKVAQVWVLGKI
jgi:3D (Asp-Asp-Asp) domain-containing protein